MTELYILGKILKKDARAVAVIGTRQVSSRGRALTEEYVKSLVQAGCTIVSGLARGVDTVAHRMALKYGGRTIAVLGSGLDIIYPPENRDLAKEIIGKGALVSPFSPGTKPLAKNFLARNRIIAKLSLAVLVIEGARRSGTLSTAAWAANEGIDVFAVPGSEATDWLISQGAIPVTKPQEVLKELNV
jgi:DNA processing protein